MNSESVFLPFFLKVLQSALFENGDISRKNIGSVIASVNTSLFWIILWCDNTNAAPTNNDDANNLSQQNKVRGVSLVN